MNDVRIILSYNTKSRDMVEIEVSVVISDIVMSVLVLLLILLSSGSHSIAGDLKLSSLLSIFLT